MMNCGPARPGEARSSKAKAEAARELITRVAVLLAETPWNSRSPPWFGEGAGGVASPRRIAMKRLNISAPRLEAGIEGHAAVDVDAGAGDVVRVIGGEPDGGAGDVVDLADALVRHQLHQLGVGLDRAPRLHIDRRADGAGADGVDADAPGGDFLGDALHHQRDPALRCRVVDVSGPRDDVVHRADADDLAGG